MTASGGSQYVGPDGMTHYQRNKEKYIRAAADRKARLNEFVVRYKSLKGCIECGIKDHRVLEFDHLGDKVADVSNIAYRGWSIKRLKDEIRKCEVVCANHHKIRTHERRKHAVVI